MSAVFLRARKSLRAGVRGWIFLALIVGLLGGVVTAIAAGARRTETAYPRFLAATRSPDFGVVTVPNETGFAAYSPTQIAELPNVTDVGRVVQFSVTQPAIIGLIAPADDNVGHSILRKKILTGRDVDPRRADEATISFTVADDLKLHVGDDLRLTVATTDDRASEPVVLHVVGIDAAPLEFPPQEGTAIDTVWTTRAFGRSHPELGTITLTAPVTPVLAIALVVPLAVLVAIVVAFASSRRVRHADPAIVLHTE